MQILISALLGGVVLGLLLLFVVVVGGAVVRKLAPLPGPGVLAQIQGRSRSSANITCEPLTLYEAAPAVLSAAERSLFGVLQNALAGEYLIFVKVRLADIIAPAKSVVGPRRQAAFNRICSKHADFILCHPQTLRVAAVLELDDRSHDLPKRQQRDDFVDGALSAAGIPVLRIPARKFYSAVEIREQVARAVCPRDNPRTEPTHLTPVSI